MKARRILAAVCMLVGAQAVLAVDPMAIDFHWSYKQRAAQRLLEQKEYLAAHQALEDLVATAPSPRDAMKCYALSAVALAYAGEADRAMESVARITEAPVADCTRMEILTISGRPAELIAAFREADVAAWPEEVRCKGLRLRAEAYGVVPIAESGRILGSIEKFRAQADSGARMQDARAAVRDFEQCAEFAGKDAETQLAAWNRAGAIYEVLGEAEKALASYQKTIALCDAKQPPKGSHHRHPQAILAAARLLKKQKRNDEAIALLEKYATPSRTWGVWILEESGDLLLALDRKAEALAKYETAARIPDLSASVSKRLAERMESLKK